jgi:hypothetical protein
VKPFETRLRNIAKAFALNTNNKLVAFARWGRKQQPNRLDTFPDYADVAFTTAPTRPSRIGRTQGGLGQRRQRQDVLRGAAASSVTCGGTRLRMRRPMRTSTIS